MNSSPYIIGSPPSWSISYRPIGFGWCTRARGRPFPIEISNLNDACLARIFRNLPLRRLLACRGVCARWRRLIDTHACLNIRRLTLLIICGASDGHGLREYFTRKHLQDAEKFGLDLKDNTEDFLIITTGLNPQACARRFPNLVKLNVYCIDQRSADELGKLAAALPDLEELTLMGSIQLGTPLLKQLTKCQNLNSLHLLTQNYKPIPPDLIQSDLAPLLPRLIHLSLADHPQYDLVHILKPLKSCQHLRLLLGNSPPQFEQLKRTFNKNKYLQKRLKRLTLLGVRMQTQDILPLICTKISSLETLDLTEITLSVDLLKQLKKLKSLSTLNLSQLYFDKKLPQISQRILATYQLPHLTSISIKKLTISHDITSSQFALILSTLFPALISLMILSFNQKFLAEFSDKKAEYFGKCRVFQVEYLGVVSWDSMEIHQPNHTSNSLMSESRDSVSLSLDLSRILNLDEELDNETDLLSIYEAENSFQEQDSNADSMGKFHGLSRKLSCQAESRDSYRNSRN